MRTRSLRWPAVAALVLVTTASGAAAGTVLRAGAPQDPVPVERAHRFYAAGPTAVYDGDSGGIGEVRPLRVAVPAGGGAYDAVVTVSLEYRTRGPGPFVLGLSVVEAGAAPTDDGVPQEPVRPRQRTLAPSTRTATTTQFVVPRLAAGTTYDVRPAVNAAFVGSGRNVVATRAVVLSVDLERH